MSCNRLVTRLLVFVFVSGFIPETLTHLSATSSWRSSYLVFKLRDPQNSWHSNYMALKIRDAKTPWHSNYMTLKLPSTQPT